MQTVEFSLIQQTSYLPVYFIGCAKDGTGGVTSRGFDYSNSLLQYFVILIIVIKAGSSFHAQR